MVHLLTLKKSYLKKKLKKQKLSLKKLVQWSRLSNLLISDSRFGTLIRQMADEYSRRPFSRYGIREYAGMIYARFQRKPSLIPTVNSSRIQSEDNRCFTHTPRKNVSVRISVSCRVLWMCLISWQSK